MGCELPVPTFYFQLMMCGRQVLLENDGFGKSEKRSKAVEMLTVYRQLSFL